LGVLLGWLRIRSGGGLRGLNPILHNTSEIAAAVLIGISCCERGLRVWGGHKEMIGDRRAL